MPLHLRERERNESKEGEGKKRRNQSKRNNNKKKEDERRELQGFTENGFQSWLFFLWCRPTRLSLSVVAVVARKKERKSNVTTSNVEYPPPSNDTHTQPAQPALTSSSTTCYYPFLPWSCLHLIHSLPPPRSITSPGCWMLEKSILLKLLYTLTIYYIFIYTQQAHISPCPKH
jgi:hypothetical protein